MSRIRIIDAIVIVVFIAAWGFYLSHEGSTRFDVNQTFTLPWLIAAETTALAILYAMFRYYRHKIKTGKLSLKQLLPTAIEDPASDDPPGKEDTTKKGNKLKND